MLLIGLAVLPVVVLLIFIYVKDRYQKEPLKLLLAALGMGMLSVIPVIFIEGVLKSLNPLTGAGGAVYDAFIMAACTEEAFKLLFLYWLIWRNKHFDEYFDGIVYAVFVSLGFALVENVLYVVGSGLQSEAMGMVVGVQRAVLSVPGHFLFAVVMGYFFALAKFHGDRKRNMWLAFLVPMILHGIYDAILMVADVSELSEGILWVAIIAFDIFLWVFAMRRLKALSGK